MSSRCGACSYRRGKCRDGCPFAPYFSYFRVMRDYDVVHRSIGPRAFLKIIQKLPPGQCAPAAFSLIYEATCRINNPVLGCVAYFLSLERQILEIREQIDELQHNSQEKTPSQNPDTPLSLENDERQIVTSFVDLTASNQKLPTSVASSLLKSSEHLDHPRMSNPTHNSPMPLRCLVPHQSHWPKFIQPGHSLQSQHIINLMERPSI